MDTAKGSPFLTPEGARAARRAVDWMLGQYFIDHIAALDGARMQICRGVVSEELRRKVTILEMSYHEVKQLGLQITPPPG